MRASRVSILAVCVVFAGCADILGIDDGIPRAQDASVDAGPPDVVEAGPPDVVEAAPDNFVPLHCGTAACDFGAGQSCCWDGGGGFACEDNPNLCTAVYVPCDRPEQCAQAADAEPNVCCAHYVNSDAGAIANSVACLPASQCTTAQNRFPLCGDDSGVECGDASCGVSSYSLPGFLICK
jgi:hypothetical protein